MTAEIQSNPYTHQQTLASQQSFSVPETLIGMGGRFVTGYCFASAFKGISWSVRLIYQTIFGTSKISEIPICLNEESFSIDERQFCTHICPLEINIPANLSSSMNFGAFSAMLLPSRQITDFAANKIASTLFPNSTGGKTIVTFGSAMTAPFISAYACNQLGFDIDPYSIYSRYTFIISGVALSIILLSNALQNYVHSEHYAKLLEDLSAEEETLKTMKKGKELLPASLDASNETIGKSILPALS